MTPEEIGRQLFLSIDAFFALGPEGKALALKAAADEGIGDEEHAVVKSLPGIPDAFVESGSDALLNLLHALVASYLKKKAEQPPTTT